MKIHLVRKFLKLDELTVEVRVNVPPTWHACVLRLCRTLYRFSACWRIVSTRTVRTSAVRSRT
eukprot:6192979-Pleurochrysis_carterae.AAC.2